MKKKVRLFPLVLAVLLLFASCRAPSPARYFFYREQDFSAELCGTLRGISFCARAAVRREGDSYRVSLVFSEGPKETASPLADLAVQAEISSDGVPRGNCEWTCLGVTVPTEASCLAGLLLPITELLTPREMSSVLKTEEGYRLRFADGSEWVLDENLRPREVCAAETVFSVLWWEMRF